MPFKPPRSKRLIDTKETDDNETPDPRTAAQLNIPLAERCNIAFEEYYKTQLFGGDNGSVFGTLTAFLESLKIALPMTLRIQQTRCKGVRVRTGEELSSLGLIPVDWVDEFVPPIESLEPSLVWECSHDEYHAKSELEYYCRKAHKGGAVNFQESVSMLPAFLLKIKHHHRIIDLCAAPGSKTTQVLDLMHRDCPDSSPSGPFPTGMVVASEFDARRAKLLLAGRVRHLNTPCCLISIAAAQSLPEQVFANQFDRVLADVPCSGDGTLRKDPNIWRSWSPKDALELHTTQLKIIRKGMRLLKPGGVAAYSTCSFNPIENEAVVAAALCGAMTYLTESKSKNASEEGEVYEYELVDIHSETLPSSLRFSPGLTHWRVPLLNNQSKYWGPKSGLGKVGKVCFDFQKGDCSRGNRCRFAHSAAPPPSASEAKSSGICYAFQNGECMRGDACRFSHLEGDAAVKAAEGTNQTSWWAEDLEYYVEQKAQMCSNSVTLNSPGWLPLGLKRTMFPASGEYDHVNQQLVRCARVLPHQQNGGGFFVALIRRKEINELPTEAASQTPTDITEEPVNKRAKLVMNDTLLTTKVQTGDVFDFRLASKDDGSLSANVSLFYGISTELFSLLLLDGNRILLTSDSLSSFLISNLKKNFLKKNKINFDLHSVGLRIFLKLQPNQFRIPMACRWRVCQEGVDWLAKHATKRRIKMSLNLLWKFLECKVISFSMMKRCMKNNDSTIGMEEVTSDNGLIPGGTLVGLAGEDAVARTVWISCFATTSSMHVYADDNSLFWIKEVLTELRTADDSEDRFDFVQGMSPDLQDITE